MNKEQVAGKVDQAVGKVEQKVGEAVGSEKLADKGATDQVKGAVKEALLTRRTPRSRSRLGPTKRVKPMPSGATA